MILCNRAFTLIELALVLVILSLMTGFGMQAFQSNSALDCYLQAEDQIKVIDRALQTYAATNNRLPKPARMEYGSNNPSFGIEAKGTVTDENDVNYATNIPNSPSNMANSGGVLMGALPVATIGLPTSFAADCWGDKYTYAVTNTLTSKNETNGYPSGAAGAITLKAGDGTNLSTTASYVVVSHGQDKYGATPMSAGDITARSCSLSGTKIDRNNCDFSDANFYNAVRNTSPSATDYFDDVLTFSAKTQFLNDCSGQTVSWSGSTSGCQASSSALSNGASAGLTNTIGGYSGTVTVTCVNGVLSKSSAVCDASAPCNTQTTTWLTNCSASSGAQLAHGASRSISNSAANYTGSSTITCNNGTLSHSGSSCVGTASCSAQTVNWSPGGVACAGPAGGLAHGGSSSVSNTNSGKSGSVTVTCNNGVLSQSGATCTVVNNDCVAQSVSWGNCSATAGALTHGNSTGVTNAAAGYTGTATATCNNGTTTASGTCNANCAAGSRTWSTNCASTYGALTHGASSTINNTNSGYAGSDTVTCTNGVISDSSTSCAVSQPPAGQVYCRDQNYTFALQSSTQFSSFSMTRDNACGVTSANALYCWGVNTTGAVGNNSTSAVASPTLIGTYKSVSTGGDGLYAHTCALNTSGVAYCWGNNGFGQLGDGTTTARLTPTAVVGAPNFSSIEVGMGYSCGIKLTNSSLWCWGNNNGTPTMINAGPFKQVSVGEYFNICAIKSDGTLYCFGVNNYGQRGIGTTGSGVFEAWTGTAVSGGLTFASVSTGYNYNCGITTSGTTYCWGYNNNGVLGNGNQTNQNTPQLVSGGNTFVYVTPGKERTGALKADGTTYYWGKVWNGTAQLTPVAYSATPTFNMIVMADANESASPAGAGLGGFCGLTGVPSATPIDGVCDNSTDGGCLSGTLSGGVTCDQSCPNTCTWTCAGSNGGATASWCSHSTPCASCMGDEGSCTGGTCNIQCNGICASCPNPNGNVSTVPMFGVGCDGSLCPVPEPVCGSTKYTCQAGNPDSCYGQDCTGVQNNQQYLYYWNCTGGNSSVSCVAGKGPVQMCFVPEALITMADGSQKKVSELKVGDEVRGGTQTNRVIKVPNYDVSQAIYGFNGQGLFVTGGHPFKTTEGWKAIDPSLTPIERHAVKPGKLEVGDVLITDGGEITIYSIEQEVRTKQHVYSPVLDGDHTYYSNGYLVHNKLPSCSDLGETC